MATTMQSGEHKTREGYDMRRDKDDFKRQQAEHRLKDAAHKIVGKAEEMAGTAQRKVEQVFEKDTAIRGSHLEGNAAGAPKRGHLAAADYSFSSIEDPEQMKMKPRPESPIPWEEETQPLLHRRKPSSASGEPIPAAEERDIKWQRGEAEPTAPVGEERASMRESIGRVQGQAADEYTRRVKPKVTQAKDALQSAYERNVSSERRAQIGHVMTRIGSGVRMVKNKALDIWEGEEPMLRRQLLRTTRLIKRYKMELPLIFLGTLLVLWASTAFVGWLAFPSTAVTTQHNREHTTPIWPGEPLQGPQPASLGDKVRESVDSLDSKLRNGMRDIRERAAATMRNIDGLPSHVSGLQDRAADVKDSAASSIPSMKELQQGASERIDNIKERVAQGIESMRASMKYPASGPPPGHTDVAAELHPDDHVKEFMDHGHVLENLPDEIPPPLESASIVDRMQQGVQQRMQGLRDTAGRMKAKVADRLNHLKDAVTPDLNEARLKMQDRLHHLKDAVTPDLGGVKDAVAGMKDKAMHSDAAQAHGIPGADIPNADDYVVEGMDEHQHVKETIHV